MPIVYEENNNSVNSNDSSAQTESKSRAEGILQAIIDGSDASQLPAPQSRAEALLLQVLQVIQNGGGGGGSIDCDTIVSDVIRKTTPDYANARNDIDVRSGNNFTYTATERCLMSISIIGPRVYRTIKVNDKEISFVAASDRSSNPEIIPLCIPLSDGDVFYISGTFDSNSRMLGHIIPYKS